MKAVLQKNIKEIIKRFRFVESFFYNSVFPFLPALAGAVETVLVPELVDSSSVITPFLMTVKNRAQINKSMFYQKIIFVKNNLGNIKTEI